MCQSSTGLFAIAFELKFKSVCSVLILFVIEHALQVGAHIYIPLGLIGRWSDGFLADVMRLAMGSWSAENILVQCASPQSVLLVLVFFAVTTKISSIKPSYFGIVPCSCSKTIYLHALCKCHKPGHCGGILYLILKLNQKPKTGIVIPQQKYSRSRILPMLSPRYPRGFLQMEDPKSVIHNLDGSHGLPGYLHDFSDSGNTSICIYIYICIYTYI